MGAARGGWPVHEMRAHTEVTERLLVDVSEAGREGTRWGRFVTSLNAAALFGTGSTAGETNFVIALL